MRTSIRAVFIVFACAGLALALSSCSKSYRKPAYPVHGQVFDKNNKPATGALVIFHPVDDSGPNPVRPLAHVDENGNFTLTTYEKNDGGPEGEYIITIEWRKSPANPFASNQEGPDRLQGKFNDPKTSKLRFKITNQPENTVSPIYLK